MSGSSGGRAARSPAAVSRSGVWLIGGTLLLAAAVLVWAFSGELPGTATTSRASSVDRPRSPRPSPSRATDAQEPPEPPAAIGPPGVPSYSALLSRDIFQPLVVPKKPARTQPESISRLVTPPTSNEGPDTWHGWRFNGLAQLSDTTYALVEQPENRRSSFLKEGDHLEDAKVIVIGANELVLQEPAGGIAHIRRVDAMAELLRATQKTSPRAPTAAAAPGTGSVPVLPGATPGGVAPGGAPVTSPAPSAVPDGFDRRDQRRRQRQGFPGEESGINANPNSAR